MPSVGIVAAHDGVIAVAAVGLAAAAAAAFAFAAEACRMRLVFACAAIATDYTDCLNSVNTN